MGLDPNDPADRNDTHESGYTYLEVYLNSITGNGSINPTVDIQSPDNHTIQTEGSSVEITASASDVDGSIAKVEFYQNDVKLGEADTAPYTFTWENVQDGTHYLTARAIDDSGTSTQSNNVTVHVHKMNSIAPWSSTDIGEPGIAGHTQLGGSDTDVTVKSAGDISGETDHFHYAYQTLEGNGEIVARVNQVTATDDGAEAGVMIRSSLDASSPFIAAMVTYVKGGQQAVSLVRDGAGNQVVHQEKGSMVTLPYWVKLVRLGDQVTSLVSKDGNDWSVIHSQSFPAIDPVYIGLAADASKPDDEVDKLNTSVFSNASVQELPADFPTAPTELVAEPGLKSIHLQWDEVQSVDSYVIYRAEIPGGPYSLQQEGITTTSYTDPNLTVGKSYYYTVKAKNNHGTSFYSNEASAVAEGEPETIYYLEDDFEDIEINTTPASYTVQPDPQTNDLKVIVTPIPTGTTGNSSTKALMLYDNGAGIAQFVRSFTPQRGSFVFEADIMSQGWPGTSTVLQLQNGTGSRTALSIELRKPSAPVAEDQYTLIYKKTAKITS